MKALALKMTHYSKCLSHDCLIISFSLSRFAKYSLELTINSSDINNDVDDDLSHSVWQPFFYFYYLKK
jgi:hypothetical protein